MTVKELASHQNFKSVLLPDPERTIDGAYVGDLLSWVMGRAKSGDAWITIMSNVNVLAVATLADVSCVILAEGVSLDEDTMATAQNKDVNVISTPLPIYEAALALADLLK